MKSIENLAKEIMARHPVGITVGQLQREAGKRAIKVLKKMMELAKVDR